MASIWSTVGRFFGPSQNDRFAELLLRLADVAVECSAHFAKTGGQDLRSIIEYEHRGDRLVTEIHELLDNAFILRFDVADSMRLTDDLDNVIDGMRKAAFHIDIYKHIVATLRPEAHELIAIGGDMIKNVRDLVAMLSDPKLSLARVRELARAIDDSESKADAVVAGAERKLVVEYSPPGANRLEFIAWNRLLEMLEETTDEANHCASQILSLARKEA